MFQLLQQNDANTASACGVLQCSIARKHSLQNKLSLKKGSSRLPFFLPSRHRSHLQRIKGVWRLWLTGYCVCVCVRARVCACVTVCVMIVCLSGSLTVGWFHSLVSVPGPTVL